MKLPLDDNFCVVAILMLRARSSAEFAVEDGHELQRTLDADAAIQTVTAELLIAGPNSRWWRLPADGAVMLGQQAVQVHITGEAGRLDLNDGDPKVIGSALQGLGYTSAARERFEEFLLARRTRGRLHTSADLDELVSLLGPPPAAIACPRNLFTLAGGQSSPDLARAPAVLVRALGSPGAGEPAQQRIGEALRIETTLPKGLLQTSVVRVGLIGERTLTISRRWVGAC